MDEPPSARVAHHAVKASLLTALDLAADAREAWLADLDQRDGVTARAVRRLVDAHVRAGAFLDLPDGDASDTTALLAPNFTIGPWVIERELGRGGMGTVYLGSRSEQGFVQHVALKVLGANVPPGAVDRLRDERRILAALHHPCIAHFVDGGATADGLPYLAMEYVDGRPVTNFCDDTGLDVRGRLALFVKICSAVHFAHQHLVVHRDIKPSNILVTADGTPKLLDFGIAKLMEVGGGLSASTVQVLTPRYASPEQAAGNPVTTATDVYSLGMLLYELLTGGGPYPALTNDASPLTALDAARHAEPERPSAVAARAGRAVLDGDLDAIVLKALRKDPADRYGSAEQFADDVQRHLDARPVLARQGSTLYAARKFVARNRAGVTAAVVAVVSLATATGVSIWQTRVAQAQRARAEARFNDVRKLANSFVFEFDETVRDIPGTTAARKLVIARSLGYLEELARDAHDDVPLQRELAAAYQRIGDVQGNPYLPNLGERHEAFTSYTRALALRETLAAAPSATDDDREALGAALVATGDLLWAEGDFSGALDHHTRANAMSRSLAAAAPHDAGRAYFHARSTYRVGQDLVKLGRFADARVAYAAAAAANGESAVPEHRRFGAVAMMKVGDALLRAGLVGEAAATYRRSADAFARLLERDPGSASIQRTHAFVLHRVAVAEAVQGHLDDAYATATGALAVQQRLSAADPGDRQTQGDIALSLATMGGLDILTRRLPDARAHLTKALLIYGALTSAGAGYIDLRSEQAVVLRRLGDLMNASGNPADALARYREAAALLEQPPNDAEYTPELVVTCLRAYALGRRVQSDGDAARWLARARTDWARLSADGVRTWMMEFGGATRLADAMADADRIGAVR